MTTATAQANPNLAFIQYWGILTLTLETVLIVNMRDILGEATKGPFDQRMNKGVVFAL